LLPSTFWTCINQNAEKCVGATGNIEESCHSGTEQNTPMNYGHHGKWKGSWKYK